MVKIVTLIVTSIVTVKRRRSPRKVRLRKKKLVMLRRRRNPGIGLTKFTVYCGRQVLQRARVLQTEGNNHSCSSD